MEEKENDARDKKSTDIDEWDQKFMQVDQEMLFEIILVHPHSTLRYSTSVFIYLIPIRPLSDPYPFRFMQNTNNRPQTI